MKIALCLHGLFDSATDFTSKGVDGYNHIKKHILDSNNVDVFIHNWQINKKDEINDLYKPKKYIYENQKCFDSIVKERNLHLLKNNPRPPQSILSHFYSIQKVFELCYSNNTKYDIVIKSRFDLGRINRNSSKEYPVQCINFNKNLDMSYFYMADWPRFNCGPADMWFYSGYENMKNFTKIYDDLNKYFYIDSDFHKFAIQIESNHGDLSNSVIFYKFWLEMKGLWNIKKPLQCFYE